MKIKDFSIYTVLVILTAACIFTYTYKDKGENQAIVKLVNGQKELYIYDDTLQFDYVYVAGDSIKIFFNEEREIVGYYKIK